MKRVNFFYTTLIIIAIFFLTPYVAHAAAWDISGMSSDSKSKYVGSQLERITASFFKSDGTVMYVMGGQDPSKIAQYTLSTAWDVSTASYANKVYSLRDNNIYWGEGMFFKSDGSVLYAVSSYSLKVHQFSLSTPWDISTASYSNASTSLSAVDSEPSGIYFRADGLKMYLAGNAGDSIYQFSLSSAWDITTASYDSVSYAIWSHISGVGTTQGVYFKDDGIKMFTVDSASDRIYQYTLSSAWDLSTAVYDNVSFSVSSQSAVPSDIFIKTDGGKLYLTEYTNVYVYQYSLADTTAPTVSSYSPTDNGVDVTATSTFRITFNESVATSTGNVTLKKTSDDSIIEIIDITSNKVSRYSSTAFTIDPTVALDAQTGYYFLIDSGSIVDTVSNAYTGITATSTWNFITESAAMVQTIATSSISVNSAILSSVINNIKGSTVTKRGFVYGTTSPDNISWSIVGSGLGISSVGTPALAVLSSTTIAFIDSTNDNLRTYQFNGNTWSLVGSGFAISSIGTPALAAISSTIVAFIDGTLDSLRTYQWNGSTWSMINGGLTINTVGTPALAALNGTDIAFIDSTNDNLRTYRFNGTTWAQVGSGLAITTVGTPTLTALNSTDVAFIDSTNDQLRVYRWSGSSWSLVGSGLSISSVGNPALATLNSTDVVFIDSTNGQTRTYRFNGSTWLQVGNNAYLSVGSPALVALSRTDIAFIDSTNISLRAYRFSMGNVAPTLSGYTSSTEETGSFNTGVFSAFFNGLSAGTIYYARAYIQNSYGYAYGNELTFTTLSDTTNPTVFYFNPVDNATGVGVNVNFEIAFNEVIATSTGNIVLYKASDDSIVEIIDIAGAQVTASSTTALIINPSVILAGQTEYYFTIAATAIDDTAGNSYAGITASTTWSFITADVTTPTILTFSPADNGTGVAITSNLTITFSETVDVELGNITIYKTSDNSIIEIIDITGGSISGSGTMEITINPTLDLGYETEYYILIDATALDDVSGNSYVGITASTTWNFTTVNTPACPTVANAMTYNFYPSCGPATCASGYILSGLSCVASGGGIPITILNQINRVNQYQTGIGETTSKQQSTNENKSAQEIAEILVEAKIVAEAKINNLLEHLNLVSYFRNVKNENKIILNYMEPLILRNKVIDEDNKNALVNFITYGTKTTKYLGEGERAGVVSSYKSAFDKLPQSEGEWNDCLKIANGRWPSEKNKETEENATKAFKKIYLREPNRANLHDDASVVIISYGLRPSSRNLISEKKAINIFKNIYGYNPKSASAWDIVRAIAYSGAKR